MHFGNCIFWQIISLLSFVEALQAHVVFYHSRTQGKHYPPPVYMAIICILQR